MTEKTCVVCGTENAENFTYCKYCGAMLPAIDKFQNQEPATVEEKRGFGDISYFEYRRYLGNGADSILADFELLDGGRKTVFSLPVLFLGLFFGFFGMSAYFFYRKLIKPAVILLLLGCIFTAVDALLNAELNQAFTGQINGILGSGFSLENTLNYLADYLSYYSYSVVQISSYIGFFAAFFVSPFALKYYKNHSHREITGIKERYFEGNSIPLDMLLKINGSTSIGLAILPFLFAAILPVICFLGSLLI